MSELKSPSQTVLMLGGVEYPNERRASVTAPTVTECSDGRDQEVSLAKSSSLGLNPAEKEQNQKHYSCST